MAGVMAAADALDGRDAHAAESLCSRRCMQGKASVEKKGHSGNNLNDLSTKLIGPGHPVALLNSNCPEVVIQGWLRQSDHKTKERFRRACCTDRLVCCSSFQELVMTCVAFLRHAKRRSPRGLVHTYVPELVVSGARAPDCLIRQYLVFGTI